MSEFNKLVNDMAIDLQDKIVKEALQKSKTYASAVRYCDKYKPELPDSYNASTGEIVETLQRNICEDAKRQIRDLAMKQVIDK
jgi:hypothetical protein